MSIIDKVVAAVTPPESDEARQEARSKARAAAAPGDWLSMAVQQHVELERLFDAVKAANAASSRVAAYKNLAVLLTGHAVAEEAVLYPALAGADEKGHATMAYTEQSAAKLQMGLLENIPPMSQEYLDKLEHIRGAVLHHMYEEEGRWFLELKEKIPSADQLKMSRRFEEEFMRYVGTDLEPSATLRAAAKAS